MEAKRNKILQTVEKMSDETHPDAYFPFINELFSGPELKQLILNKLNKNNNVSTIDKLYFLSQPNIFFISLPKEIILNKIFQYLLFQTPEEIKKIPLINKFFKKLVFEYHLIHSIMHYKLQIFIPILCKTSKQYPPKIDINHVNKTLMIASPIYIDENGKETKHIDCEFRCRAINDYYASVTDELDLKTNHIYTIMQTSPSGWWYAVNEQGEDGWVPSMYLERISGHFESALLNYPESKQNEQERYYYKADIHLRQCPFPYTNVKYWEIYDENQPNPHEIIKANENTINYAMLNVVLNSCKNISFLVVNNIITGKLWVNEKLSLKSVEALIIKNQVKLKLFIHVSLLLSKHLVYLSLEDVDFKFDERHMDNYSFINNDNRAVSLKTIYDRMLQKDFLGLSNKNDQKQNMGKIYWKLSVKQFEMETVSFILAQYSNHLLVFNYSVKQTLNELSDNFSIKGCLRIPKYLEWLRLKNFDCLIDLNQNDNKLMAIVFDNDDKENIMLNSKQFKPCKQRYNVRFIIDNNVKKLNEGNNESLDDEMFSNDGSNIGKSLMKIQGHLDEIEIENRLTMYREWWKYNQCLWLKQLM